MAKDLMVGFKRVNLAPVVTNTTDAYVTEAAMSLPWAGKMSLTPKETSQDIYYDDDLYLTIKELRGYEVELRMAQIEFEVLQTLGLGTFDEDTNTFNENMQVVGGEYALRFVADTPDRLPFYYNFRSFKITEITPDSFATKTDSLTPNELIIKGSISSVLATGLSYKSIMKLLPNSSNLNACNAFLTDAETYPDTP
ncbi:hypothetical protein AGMMS49992_33050 [Clostridia bacterium]|nr:hypothetical protein AGMMS49992_33050 [Clostridia bacterium]